KENLPGTPPRARVELGRPENLGREVRGQGRVRQLVEGLAQRHFFLPDRLGLRIVGEERLQPGFFFNGQLAAQRGVKQLVENRVVHGVDIKTNDRRKLRLPHSYIKKL